LVGDRSDRSLIISVEQVFIKRVHSPVVLELLGVLTVKPDLNIEAPFEGGVFVDDDPGRS
jgi:hypothetical protein